MKKPKTDILLVGCVGGKRNQKSPARYLYDSALWNFRHEYAERQGYLWYILSAKHGLLHPDTIIKPYDCKLSAQSAAERCKCAKWSQRVLCQLGKEVWELKGKTVEIHAGKEYVEYGLEESLRKAEANVHRPLKGLRIGEQLQWYKRYLASGMKR